MQLTCSRSQSRQVADLLDAKPAARIHWARPPPSSPAFCNSSIRNTWSTHEGFPGDASGKEPNYQCRRSKRYRFNPWVWKIPWSRKYNPLQYSCLENPHGQRATVHKVAESQTELSDFSTSRPRNRGMASRCQGTLSDSYCPPASPVQLTPVLKTKHSLITSSCRV